MPCSAFLCVMHRRVRTLTRRRLLRTLDCDKPPQVDDVCGRGHEPIACLLRAINELLDPLALSRCEASMFVDVVRRQLSRLFDNMGIRFANFRLRGPLLTESGSKSTL